MAPANGSWTQSHCSSMRQHPYFKLLVACLLLGQSAPALAEESTRRMLRMRYSEDPRADSCPGEAALREQIRARMDYDPFREDASEEVAIRVAPRDRELVISIEYRGDNGTLFARRQFNAPNSKAACTALTTYAALSIAFTLMQFGLDTPSRDAAPTLPAAPRRRHRRRRSHPRRRRSHPRHRRSRHARRRHRHGRSPPSRPPRRRGGRRRSASVGSRGSATPRRGSAALAGSSGSAGRAACRSRSRAKASSLPRRAQSPPTRTRRERAPPAAWSGERGPRTSSSPAPSSRAFTRAPWSSAAVSWGSA